MSIDLSKLPPAPWFVHPKSDVLCHGDVNDDSENYPLDDPYVDEFTALARNAVAVQERRQWSVLFHTRKMWLIGFFRDDQVWPPEMPDEYKTIIEAWEAMVEADKWLTEQEKTS